MARVQREGKMGQNVRLVISMGDPAGIGPEVVLKALVNPPPEAEITLVGARSHLQATYTQLREITPLANPDDFEIIDIPLVEPVIWGEGTAATGAASFAYLERAIAATLAGEFEAIVTAPINKSLWQAAGHNYPGQTEVLAMRGGAKQFGMLFVARSPHSQWLLITLLATTHIPLNQVPQVLNPDLMARKLDLLVRCLQQDFALEQPKVAIAGLNPHSGEEGNLGREEVDWLIPWLEQERKQRPDVELIGPVPPDTLWVKPGQAWYGDRCGNSPVAGVADGYLALYHDQGLIPVKLMAFDQAINTTIGLPFVRTSPDHGTAFDIAGRGIARGESMAAAIALAVELAENRRQ
ncbi:4-hydroxythreonine-4-phosphate dehydrogenase PdxA [Spirulina sp. CCNP1310]|uniref:4-hydroxythreonine-4-phosphate dehydrogenase PdxA n=1 Tax=Spirulina sp. CCNP1310 TaxID=3110249 RepID=UPI002B201A32|nr:4-hydroxythreonine-4-phosphate dehydrogenase PdxA [Spirulina sp. CCNP1310]MEA5420003.1 4-hydroxythreonine-4-phosphate dehydrogenase PdxA [Spirulina sp. CCNP1310]